MRFKPRSFRELSAARLGLAGYQNRFVIRLTFVILMLSVFALASYILSEEKQRSYQNFDRNMDKTMAEAIARLRHPTGQFALINPQQQNNPLQPVVLPYSALDFSNLNKAQLAVEMSGCGIQMSDGSTICLAYGNQASAGAYIYIVGQILSNDLVGRQKGELDLQAKHRAVIRLNMPGFDAQWLAPLESINAINGKSVQGQLSAFTHPNPAENPILPMQGMPLKDFNGWFWQNPTCVLATSDDNHCKKRSFFSIRLPVGPWQEAMHTQPNGPWPPTDINQLRVQLQIFEPYQKTPIFDSHQELAKPAFSLKDLKLSLQKGEKLSINKHISQDKQVKSVQIMEISNLEQDALASNHWLNRLVAAIPVDFGNVTLKRQSLLQTFSGEYDLNLSLSPQAIDQEISAVAFRVSGFLAIMIGAILLAWIIIELSFIRRVATLTKRAAHLYQNMPAGNEGQKLQSFDLDDLKGSDEMGILASTLSKLLHKIKDDAHREQIRAEQEQQMWHAVGHEIMSPLQSLLVLHGSQSDPSHRYVQRMQHAVRVMYGQASISEALQAANLQISVLDLKLFLETIAQNASYSGIDAVVFQSKQAKSAPVWINADEFSLEDAISHILRNAHRHRIPHTPIEITLSIQEQKAKISIFNQGALINPDNLNRIFEYGVSEYKEKDGTAPYKTEQRGQGLFVVRTYLAKMGGSVYAENSQNGVTFIITMPILYDLR